MMAQGPLRFSTIGKPILRTFDFFKIFRFFDLPYGQGHGQDPMAKSMLGNEGNRKQL